VKRLAVRIGRTDLETTARVLEELCRRLEADDAQDIPRASGGGGGGGGGGEEEDDADTA
jgi:hypothetical protein